MERRYKKYNFLFLWGFLMAAGSGQQCFSSNPHVSLLESPAFLTATLLAGVLLMISYFVINKDFLIGRRLAVAALLLSIACYIFEFLFYMIFSRSSLPFAADVAVFIALTALLAGYAVFLFKKPHG